MTGIEQKILDLIGRNEGYSVSEFANEFNASEKEVKLALERLMERGKITSTPDWEYRLARRSVNKDSNPEDGD